MGDVWYHDRWPSDNSDWSLLNRNNEFTGHPRQVQPAAGHIRICRALKHRKPGAVRTLGTI